MKCWYREQQLWISGKPTEIQAHLRELLIKTDPYTKIIDIVKPINLSINKKHETILLSNSEATMNR